MLPWQQSMLDQWDHYSVDQPAALKRKALAMAVGIYALGCLLFFIPHLQHTQPATVFIHGATAPVLFMSNGVGNGKGSARLRHAQKMQARKKACAQAEQKKVQPKQAPVLKKPDPKKGELPARKSVVKQPKKKSKKELLAEKKKAQAEALKVKKLEAAKAAAEKAAKEKAERDKRDAEKKLQEKQAQEKIELEKSTPDLTEEEVQDIFIDQGFADGADAGSGYDPALKAHMALSRSILRVWRPPQVQMTTPVRVVAQVDASGKVADVQLETKSGVVAYDIAARAAVLRAEFPKEFWGKSVALVFGA